MAHLSGSSVARDMWRYNKGGQLEGKQAKLREGVPQKIRAPARIAIIGETNTGQYMHAASS